jgi:mRNA interferase RelE/StbE
MYKLDFSIEGRTSLASLDKKTGQRVLDKLKWLIQNIGNIPLLPLKGNLSGLYKLKVGDWRVLYEVNHDKKIITVHKAGHRKEIYK